MIQTSASLGKPAAIPRRVRVALVVLILTGWAIESGAVHSQEPLPDSAEWFTSPSFGDGSTTLAPPTPLPTNSLAPPNPRPSSGGPPPGVSLGSVAVTYTPAAALDAAIGRVEAIRYDVALNLGGPIRENWIVSLGPRYSFSEFKVNADFRTAVPLPRRLHAAALDVLNIWKFKPFWSLHAGITPGFYSDGVNTGPQALRVPGRLLVFYEASPRVTWVGGVVATALPDIPILPAIGVVVTPSERWRFDLTAPKLRITHRPSTNWDLYGLFEFGGVAYGVRLDEADRIFESREFRLALGIEGQPRIVEEVGLAGRGRGFAELGVALGRTLRLDGLPERDLEPALSVRMGWKF
ncbi:hypothetical protein Isop_2756 [Isosphaera pallida ATCC 43644]|uniref:DUF6268 domain-containing protein n=1 Tax=Isosphaera pallida (strain ATCC 43644 / DSM 9630 / IS1B) TaxID=575540 RepID=E8R0J0_ISOPI|nr:DUF6268 family outer membrane beta-barrel protein [Isosphaera pallida]ADV63322.1 hypothetical protein Isop_2756 [Isosphaera pallida ATCC 43644]